MQQNQRVGKLADEQGSGENGGDLPQNLLCALNQTCSLARLDELSRTLWSSWSHGELADDQASLLAECLETRRKTLRGLDIVAVRAPQIAAQARLSGRRSHFPPKRRQPVSPDRLASITRRRTLAASGPMPPALAAKFTTSELAALRIVADEVRDRKDCRLVIGAIAARAGIGVTTARRALRLAARYGLLIVEERRRHLQRNLPNIVRILSSEWMMWIKRGQKFSVKRQAPDNCGAVEGGGRQKIKPTDISSFRTVKRNRPLGGQTSIHNNNRPSKDGRLRQTC